MSRTAGANIDLSCMSMCVSVCACVCCMHIQINAGGKHTQRAHTLTYAHTGVISIPLHVEVIDVVVGTDDCVFTYGMSHEGTKYCTVGQNQTCKAKELAERSAPSTRLRCHA